MRMAFSRQILFLHDFYWLYLSFFNLGFISSFVTAETASMFPDISSPGSSVLLLKVKMRFLCFVYCHVYCRSVWPHLKPKIYFHWLCDRFSWFFHAIKPQCEEGPCSLFLLDTLCSIIAVHFATYLCLETTSPLIHLNCNLTLHSLTVPPHLPSQCSLNRITLLLCIYFLFFFFPCISCLYH